MPLSFAEQSDLYLSYPRAGYEQSLSPHGNQLKKSLGYPHSQRRCDTVAPRVDFQKLRGKDMWPTQSQNDANDLGQIVGWYWGKKCDESISESNLGHDGLILGHAHFKDIMKVWTSFVEWVETVETSLLVTILKISTHLWPLKHMKNQLKDLKFLLRSSAVDSTWFTKRFSMLYRNRHPKFHRSCLLPMIGVTSQ